MCAHTKKKRSKNLAYVAFETHARTLDISHLFPLLPSSPSPQNHALLPFLPPTIIGFSKHSDDIPASLDGLLEGLAGILQQLDIARLADRSADANTGCDRKTLLVNIDDVACNVLSQLFGPEVRFVRRRTDEENSKPIEIISPYQIIRTDG